MPETPYWIVVSDEGPASKPKQYATCFLACQESLRLSKAYPGISFGVFKYLGRANTPKPVVQKTTFYRYEEPSLGWLNIPYALYSPLIGV